MVARWLGDWMAGWLARWLVGWVAGWVDPPPLGSWAVAGPPPPPLPPTDRNRPFKLCCPGNRREDKRLSVNYNAQIVYGISTQPRIEPGT